VAVTQAGDDAFSAVQVIGLAAGVSVAMDVPLSGVDGRLPVTGWGRALRRPWACSTCVSAGEADGCREI
jgi:hypothetical protein